jgi:hypothetical protein
MFVYDLQLGWHFAAVGPEFKTSGNGPKPRASAFDQSSRPEGLENSDSNLGLLYERRRGRCGLWGWVDLIVGSQTTHP